MNRRNSSINDLSVLELNDDGISEVVYVENFIKAKEKEFLDGQILQTGGYYTENDGGGAFYKIYKRSNSRNLVRFLNVSFVDKGLTMTFNENGDIVVNGTVTSNLNNGFQCFESLSKTLANTKYSFSYEYVSGEVTANKLIVAVNVTNQVRTSYMLGIDSNNLMKRISTNGQTTDAEGTLTTIQFMANKGTVCNNLTFHLQFEEGTTVSDWVNGGSSDLNTLNVPINDEFIARLLPEDETINIRQLGARSLEQGVIEDTGTYIRKYIDILKFSLKTNKKYRLYIPSGTWLTTPVHVDCNYFYMFGNREWPSTTCITAYETSQDYLIKIGGFPEADNTKPVILTRNACIKNIVFSSGFRSGYNIEAAGFSNYSEINYGLIILEGCTYSTFDHLYFFCFTGAGLILKTTWECYFGIMNFRIKRGFDKPALWFAKGTQCGSIAVNISACEFQSLMFEGINGDSIFAEAGSGFTHNEFVNINQETDFDWADKYNIATLQKGEDTSNYRVYGMFKGMSRTNIFGTIAYVNNNCGRKLVSKTDPNDVIIYGGVFVNNFDEEESAYNCNFTISVGSLSIRPSTGYHQHVLYARNHHSWGLVIGSLISADGNLYKPFNIEDAKPPRIGASRYNEPDDCYMAYKYIYGDGCCRFDEKCLGEYRIAVCTSEKQPGILVNKLPYPFSYSNDPSTKHKILISAKAGEGVSYRIGVHEKNKDSVNSTVSWIQTPKIVGTGNFEDIVCDINFHKGNLIQITVQRDDITDYSVAIEYIKFIY